MTSWPWPSVQIEAPADGASIYLDQVGPTDIACNIVQNNDGRILDLTNCTATPDCQTLASQTKVLFFDVNVSITLALTSVSEATATIDAPNGQTVHAISAQSYADATAFIANCHLPAPP